MSGPPKPGEVDTDERRRRARPLLIQAALWSPSMNEKDTTVEAMADLPDLEDSPPARWPGPSDADIQLSPTQPTARRSETAPVVRVKSLPYGSNSTVV